MSNAAKKIIEVDLSNKWPVGTVLVHRWNKKTCMIASYIGDDRAKLVHASGEPSAPKTKTLEDYYREANEDEARIFAGARIAPDADSAMAKSKGEATPRKANDEEPKSEPPPAPPPPAANDSPPKTELSLVAAMFNDTLRQMSERIDRQEARFMAALKDIVAAQHATQPTASLPSNTERDAKAEKDAQLTARHKAEFKDLLIEFTLLEFDRVDIGNRAGQERALESGEVYRLFAAWCEQNKKHNERPYQHAIFSLLDNHPHRRDLKVTIKRGKRDKVMTEYVLKNRKQTALPFTDPSPGVLKSLTALTDARQIFDIARSKVWPDISDAYLAIIQRILETGEFTNADVLAAVHAVSNPIAGSDRRYTPAEILTPASIRLLVQRESTKAKVGR